MREFIKTILPFVAIGILGAIILDVWAERITDYTYGVLMVYGAVVVVAFVAWFLYDGYHEKEIRWAWGVVMLFFSFLSWYEYVDVQNELHKKNGDLMAKFEPAVMKSETYYRSSKQMCQVEYHKNKTYDVNIRQYCKKKNCGTSSTTEFKKLSAGTSVVIDVNRTTSGWYIDEQQQKQVINFYRVVRYYDNGKNKWVFFDDDKWISKNVINDKKCKVEK